VVYGFLSLEGSRATELRTIFGSKFGSTRIRRQKPIERRQGRHGNSGIQLGEWGCIPSRLSSAVYRFFPYGVPSSYSQHSDDGSGSGSRSRSSTLTTWKAREEWTRGRRPIMRRTDDIFIQPDLTRGGSSAITSLIAGPSKGHRFLIFNF